MGFCIISGIFVYFVYPETTLFPTGTSNLAVDDYELHLASDASYHCRGEISDLNCKRRESKYLFTDRHLIPAHLLDILVFALKRTPYRPYIAIKDGRQSLRCCCNSQSKVEGGMRSSGNEVGSGRVPHSTVGSTSDMREVERVLEISTSLRSFIIRCWVGPNIDVN